MSCCSYSGNAWLGAKGAGQAGGEVALRQMSQPPLVKPVAVEGVLHLVAFSESCPLTPNISFLRVHLANTAVLDKANRR